MFIRIGMEYSIGLYPNSDKNPEPYYRGDNPSRHYFDISTSNNGPNNCFK